jgi:tRNA pseudouridine38-40 synthase
MDVCYDGSEFHGWQSQKNAYSVQQAIEEALEKILQKRVAITGSGRTDTGVHAKQQIVHFDLEDKRDLDKLQYQLNAVLPKSVAVKSLKRVKDEAHARFDAVSRKYHYFIHSQKNPFKEGQSFYFHQTLNLEAISEACSILLKTKDFESFSRVKTEVNHFNCDMYECRWDETSEGYLFTVKANRFLRGMVRAIVGTLIDVGLSKLSLEDFALIVEQKDRRAAGAAAPAHGLYLTEVNYPEEIYLD